MDSLEYLMSYVNVEIYIWCVQSAQYDDVSPGRRVFFVHSVQQQSLWSMLVHFGGQAQTHTRPLVLVLGLHGLLILGDNPTVQVLLYFL